jgi:tetratricopeptide (TPR) repeat protein
LALGLVLGTFVAYLPVWHAGLIWDDRSFVVDNPLIRRPDGLIRFWFTTEPEDYYPVTSTMLWAEWRIWGAHPAGYHVVNVALHAGSAVVLWRLLERLKVPGGWLAAALFAVHPVNVESVAWITQRKNTLAMLLYLLSLSSYLRFELGDVRAGGNAGPADERSASPPIGLPRGYWLSLAVFLLALLSKTSVAPMPIVLLGLIWFLRGTVTRRDVRRIWPFFAAAVVVGLVAAWFQSVRAIGSEAVRTDGFGARLAGAGWAIWFYLYKAALPIGLSSIYPRWNIDGGAWWAYVPDLGVVALAFACWRSRRAWGRAPLAALGYFVVMLLPVLGFLDIGFMWVSLVADHWQYFAMLGPIALAASAWERASRLGGGSGVLPAAVAAGAVLVSFGGLTWNRCGIYRDEGTFWQAALASNPGSWSAHNGLGSVLHERGQSSEAIAHFRKAVELKPDFSTAYYNLGGVLRERGQLDEAMAEFAKAVEIQPDYSTAHYYLGELLRDKGRVDEAIAHLEKAVALHSDYAAAHESLGFLYLRKGQTDKALAHFRSVLVVRPGDAEGHNNLASLLWQTGHVAEAIAHYERALQIRPDYALAHHSLGGLFEQQGRTREAMAHYERALEIDPTYAAASSSLAWVLATSPDASVRDGARAVALAQEAQRLSGGKNPIYGATLAASLAESGRYPEAAETATAALRLATDAHKTALATLLQAQIELYRAGSPYRDTRRQR